MYISKFVPVGVCGKHREPAFVGYSLVSLPFIAHDIHTNTATVHEIQLRYLLSCATIVQSFSDTSCPLLCLVFSLFTILSQ